MPDRMASKTLRNLLLSLAVVLVPVAVVMAIFTHNPPAGPKAVDWESALDTARHESPYAVLAPTLPNGWTATKASWVKQGAPLPDGSTAVGNSWSTAWISPDTLYYGLEQRDALGPDLVDKATRHGTTDGTSEVGGASWKRYVSPDARTRALVKIDGALYTVVSGDVPYASLEEFAATLR